MGIIGFIQNAPFGVFLFMMAVPAALIGIGAFVAWRTLGQIRALKAAIVLTPAQARPGYCRVDGKAAPLAGKALVSPLTRGACVWYRAKVEEWKRIDRDKSDWRVVREDESDHPFLLRHDGGEIRVEPWRAEVTPTDKSLWNGAAAEPTDRDPPRVKAWENPKGNVIQVEIAGGANHRFRYTEERIYPGDPVFVLGEIVRVADEPDVDDDDEEDDQDDEPVAADSDVRDEAPPAPPGSFVLRYPGQRGKPFLISTTEPTQHLDLQRWGVIGTGFIAAFGAVLLALLIWMRLA
jgi:hypothetical protein